ncbi:MAG TPA: outer membrane lipoprotein carrier protein LolA [Candidatus Saccharimonadales bacterium]|nr:outer membrane lipoprotein carrier protein LolA [Candidatus Saccharimonadales bacterium]
MIPARFVPSCYTHRVNLKYKLGFVVLFLATAVCDIPVSSQAPAPQASDQAKSLAHLLEEHYRRPRTLQAVFLERFNEGQKQSRMESGTVYFRRPGQMRWEYDSPEKKLFLVDGKTKWFYVPYDHTVTKSPVKESSDWRTPLSLLTGKADLSRMCSKIDLATQPGIPEGHAVLRCIPKGEKDASAQDTYTEVLLEVDTSSGELARIEIRQPGGIDLEYRFGNWRTDIPLTADLFKFQVPNGVAIVNGASMEGPQ